MIDPVAHRVGAVLLRKLDHPAKAERTQGGVIKSRGATDV
jgi:hypothetical protein